MAVKVKLSLRRPAFLRRWEQEGAGSQRGKPGCGLWSLGLPVAVPFCDASSGSELPMGLVGPLLLSKYSL